VRVLCGHGSCFFTQIGCECTALKDVRHQVMAPYCAALGLCCGRRESRASLLQWVRQTAEEVVFVNETTRLPKDRRILRVPVSGGAPRRHGRWGDRLPRQLERPFLPRFPSVEKGPTEAMARCTVMVALSLAATASALTSAVPASPNLPPDEFDVSFGTKKTLGLQLDDHLTVRGGPIHRANSRRPAPSQTRLRSPALQRRAAALFTCRVSQHACLSWAVIRWGPRGGEGGGGE
jgi:hypothetical protein